MNRIIKNHVNSFIAKSWINDATEINLLFKCVQYRLNKNL